MTTFTITDRSRRESKTESFLEKTITVKSHSGLHPAECALIENLPSIKKSSSLLIAGNRTGAVAMVASKLLPGCSITCHTCDIHHAGAILRNLKGNSIEADFISDEYVLLEDPLPPEDIEEDALLTEESEECHELVEDTEIQSSGEKHNFTVACTSSIPESSFDNALFMITPATITGELSLNLLEDIHKSLKTHGRCLLSYDGEAGAFTKQLKSVFGSISILDQSRKGSTFLCTKKGELKKPRDFTAEFEASIPGSERIKLISTPGVFSHRRPDNGGLALAEIAAPLIKPGMRVMDFGCGCGMVGALLSLKEPEIQLTFVDSAIRAINSTHRNIQALGLKDAQLILSATGTKEDEFDVFTGNPPYYSDYRIAELFIDQAYYSLKFGGTALIVTKQSRKLEELIYESFGNAEITPRRGYSVITAVKM